MFYPMRRLEVLRVVKTVFSAMEVGTVLLTPRFTVLAFVPRVVDKLFRTSHVAVIGSSCFKNIFHTITSFHAACALLTSAPKHPVSRKYTGECVAWRG